MPEGWLRNANGVAYPPPPWRLRGSMVLSLWRVSPDLPAELVPDPLSPQLWIGRAIVATAFAVYETGGVLSYNEFLIAVRVTAGEKGMVHVPHIWVDSASSTAGARALWAVPKQMAAFEIVDDSVFSAEAFTESGPIARLRFTPRLALPGRWPLRTRIGQQDLRQSNSDKLEITRVEASARMMMGSAEWAFPGTSPAAFLLGHRPFLSLRLDGMTMTFGV